MITSYKDKDLAKFAMNAGEEPEKVPKMVKTDAFGQSDEAWKWLQTAERFWTSMRDMRDRALKNRKYHRGDQWHELVEDPDSGETMTEEDFIKQKGKLPFKQNLIRQMMRNIEGQFILNPTDTIAIARDRAKGSIGDMMTNAVRYANDINRADKLDVNSLYSSALSGIAARKYGFAYMPTRDIEEIRMKNVDYNRIFFNDDVQDPRLDDLYFVGELLDTTLDNIIANFATNEEEEEAIRNMYRNVDQMEPPSHPDAFKAEDNVDNISFLAPLDQSLCRVVEVWRKSSEWRTWVHDYMDASWEVYPESVLSVKGVEAINKKRTQEFEKQGIPADKVPLMKAERKFEQIWKVKYITPHGDILYEGETPYEHQEHPYVISAYPMINGEVWGLIEDVIDQQRGINRYITMMDFIIGASAKGVLLVPDTAIESDAALDAIADEWSKFNGVIKYKPKPGVEIPTQISANSTNIGIMEMIQMQMKLFQDIMGVSEAIQGQEPKSGTPSSLYAQQAENSMINLKSFFQNLKWFKQDCDLKAMKLIKQFYTTERYLAINGRSFNDEVQIYDPAKVKDLDFDIYPSQTADTPVYRQIIDDSLREMMLAGLIDLEMYLENSSMPFADKLLENVRQRKEEVQAGGMPQQFSQEEMQQIEQAAQQGDPKAQEIVQKILTAN